MYEESWVTLDMIGETRGTSFWIVLGLTYFLPIMDFDCFQLVRCWPKHSWVVQATLQYAF